MDSKICVVCNTEKSVDKFYNKYRECKPSNIKSLKRYYESKDKISKYQKLYYEKNRDKLLQKQNDRYINYKGLHRSYVELENKLKIMEENLKYVSINDSENN